MALESRPHLTNIGHYNQLYLLLKTQIKTVYSIPTTKLSPTINTKTTIIDTANTPYNTDLHTTTTQSISLLTSEPNFENTQSTESSKQLDIVNSQSNKTQIESTSDTKSNDAPESNTTQSTNGFPHTTSTTTSTTSITQPVQLPNTNTIKTTASIIQSESSKQMQMDSGNSQLNNKQRQKDTIEPATLLLQIIDSSKTYNDILPIPSIWQYTSCPDQVRQKLEQSFTTFSDASNQIPSLLLLFQTCDTEDKKTVAQKLLSIIHEVTIEMFSYIAEAEFESDDGLVVHESHYYYPSPYFQSFFDIIFQKKILSIIQESLLDPVYQFHLSSPLQIQTTLMLMKRYFTDITVPKSIKQTITTLHAYAFYVFICSPPSQELQPLHLYYTQNLRTSYEYMTSESHEPYPMVRRHQERMALKSSSQASV
jgi:hypothetical protein